MTGAMVARKERGRGSGAPRGETRVLWSARRNEEVMPRAARRAARPGDWPAAGQLASWRKDFLAAGREV